MRYLVDLFPLKAVIYLRLDKPNMGKVLRKVILHERSLRSHNVLVPVSDAPQEALGCMCHHQLAAAIQTYTAGPDETVGDARRGKL